LCSFGYIDGLYYKPRIDKQTLAEYSEGLIATTCCIASEINQTIINGTEEEAKKLFEWYVDLFGEDFYIELQRHGLKDQDKCNEVLIRWAREYNVKMIATNDSHYIDRDDSEAHDILLALQTNADLNDPNRFRFTDDNNVLNREFYLKTPDEMKELFKDVPDSIDNTNEIVDKVEKIDLSSELLLPSYNIPKEFNSMDDYLRHMTYEGAKKRYGEISQEVSERIETELGIIKTMGFAGYFLIVQGFTTEARRRGVYVGPGRGSAAGSVVAYTIGIINIDPLKYDLLFERFLNPERVSPPDIDIDFDDTGRQEVIDYVVEQYGRENVAQIVTYGTMKAKTSIRDVGRVLGVPLQKVNEISKIFPEKPGLDTFDKVLNPEKNPESYKQIKSFFNDEDAQVRKMMQYARVLEGSARQTGIHAAGVIIAPGKVYDYLPVALSKEKDVITQYDGPSAEDCGLLKMDFLGLKTLSVLKTVISYVKNNYGKVYDLDDIPLDDSKTFELYQRGDTVGTFQFESDGMRKYLKMLRPTELDDLIAMNALYRPGPMEYIPTYIKRKHGEEEVKYPHEMLEGILNKTYGIPVYQEQVMQMAQVMGGFSLGKADILRRGMGKKKKDVLDSMYPEFINGAKKQEVTQKVAEEVWNQMSAFAGYGFNKSHAAAYSVVAYQTAYFKANYPAEYMAAVLTHNMGDIKKVSQFIEESRRMGIPVDVPDINSGEGRFVAKENRIQYGLEAIKGVGSGAVESIVHEREEEGDFTSIFDLTSRIDLRACNRKSLESLIQAGALEGFNKNRAQLMEVLDDSIQYAAKIQHDKMMNQASLFGGEDGSSGMQEPKMPEVNPWTSMQRLKKERELIGFYLSGHPLDKFRDDVDLFCTHTLDQKGLDQLDDRANVTVAGIITAVKRATDRSGRPIAFVTIEDEVDSVEILVFSRTYDDCMNLLVEDTLIVVEGSLSKRDENVKVIANRVDRLENMRERYQNRIRLMLTLKTEELTEQDLINISSMMERSKGQTQVRLKIDSVAAKKPFSMSARRFVIDPTNDLLTNLRKILGDKEVYLEKLSA
jgi:DNA polymerase-3 subunit alpha